MTEGSEEEIRKLRRLNEAQSRLVTAVQDLSLARTLPAIQEVVRRAARAIAGADGATFVLREGETCFYADEDAISPLWKGQRFPLSACISGWSMLHAQPVVVPDIYADARVPQDAYRPTFVKSLVMVPIRKQSPIGAIGVYWADERLASTEQVELLQALANTTAVAMEDVQVYSELEQRVERRTRQLQALNNELEAFSYSVSHDLRAPLRTINGFIDLLEQELAEGNAASAQEFLKRVRGGADRMDRLIQTLLELANVARQEIRRSDVNLSAAAQEIMDRLRAENPARPVEVAIAPGLSALADPRLVSVVLENLLSNAWKYTSKAARPRIEFGSDRVEGECIFWVRDNGAGFDPQYADKLFSPFQRLHTANEFPGTGVGLATVQRIIHRHGGRIWAEAQPNQGATFRFTLSEKSRTPTARCADSSAAA